ncbi:MAG: hypothetical protein K8U57_07535 [Planctomycetes bacterium]|nr:hypothetical protein [Planctomycetota bacterium]
MLSVTLVGDKELVARLEAMPDKLRAALLRKVTYLALRLENKVKTDKLSGQVLNHKSGRLWRSIQHSVASTPTSVTGKVYSAGDVKYAAIHEFGGTTKPHIIEAKSAGSLAFAWNGKQAFFKRVNHPGSKIPERSYLRSSLADMRDEIVAGLEEAASQALQP